jgi:hypothetical protein
MNRAYQAMTITRMDAGVEPPWMVSRRVIARYAGNMPFTANEISLH